MAIFLAAGIGIGPEKGPYGKTFYVENAALKIKRLETRCLPQINFEDFLQMIQFHIGQSG